MGIEGLNRSRRAARRARRLGRDRVSGVFDGSGGVAGGGGSALAALRASGDCGGWIRGVVFLRKASFSPRGPHGTQASFSLRMADPAYDSFPFSRKTRSPRKIAAKRLHGEITQNQAESEEGELSLRPAPDSKMAFAFEAIRASANRCTEIPPDSQ